MDIKELIQSIPPKNSEFEDEIGFECIEVSVTSSEITDYRIYSNSRSRKFDRYDKLPLPLQSFVKDYVKINPEFVFLDCSVRGDSTYSVNFIPRKGTDLNELGRKIDFLYDPTRLSNYGFLIDSASNILQIKEYYKISIEDTELLERLIDSGLRNKILSNPYRPFLYGINRQEGHDEEKAYFINSITDLSRFKINHAKDMITSINLPDSIDDILNEVYNKGLWFRGFAYSKVNGKDLWRLYFYRAI